ncbi:E3 ubiquitin-protein ligase LNX [Fukomys damarensis]|uniref:E3 ubiquitin-protein ligase LNX n=1 Tax=Fukomys damarensis TaxID=885580 RepID=A0A091CRK3_FUKDA|nr:E3 ubiquitin-protein ligase LNX [Fukomys damarensis]
MNKSYWNSTLRQPKLTPSRAVDGFHSEKQKFVLQVQGQHRPQQHHHHHQQAQPPRTVPRQAQTQQTLVPASPQATAPQATLPDSKLIQQMSASDVSAAATAAASAVPAGLTPAQQMLTDAGQLLRAVRAARGAQDSVQPRQSVVLQQQVTHKCGLVVNKLLSYSSTDHCSWSAATKAQPTQQQAPLVSQVDGTGDTSSGEDEDEEEDCDDGEEEAEEKVGEEDGQVEEEPLSSEGDVNGMDISNVPHNFAVGLLQQPCQVLWLTVLCEQKFQGGRSRHALDSYVPQNDNFHMILNKSTPEEQLGIKLVQKVDEPGVFIFSVLNGGVAY